MSLEVDRDVEVQAKLVVTVYCQPNLPLFSYLHNPPDDCQQACADESHSGIVTPHKTFAQKQRSEQDGADRDQQGHERSVDRSRRCQHLPTILDQESRLFSVSNISPLNSSLPGLLSTQPFSHGDHGIEPYMRS